MSSSPMSTSAAAPDSPLFAHPLPGFLEEPGAGRRRFEDFAGIDAADLIDRHAIGGGALGIELAALGIDLLDQRGDAGGLCRIAYHGIAVIALADSTGAARRIEGAALREGADAHHGKQQCQGETPRKSTWF